MIQFDLSKDVVRACQTSPYLRFVLDATSFCLAKNNHHAGVIVAISGYIIDSLQMTWEAMTDEMKNTYNSPNKATEYGAEGIAFVIIDRFTDYQIGPVSFIGSGFDYYLRPKAKDATLSSLSEGYVKLEISGIDRKSSTNSVGKRIKEKCQQAATIADGIEYLVVVAEFGDPIVEVKHGYSN